LANNKSWSLQNKLCGRGHMFGFLKVFPAKKRRGYL
jgi:hypothetical protein